MYSELEPVQTHESEERIFGRRPFGGFGGFGRPFGGFGGFGRPFVDLEALEDHLDLEALEDHLDLEALEDHLDLEALEDRLDLEALEDRSASEDHSLADRLVLALHF